MKTLHLIFALSLLLTGGLNANERISSEYATVASKPGYRPVLKSQGEGSPVGSYFDDVGNISTIVNINQVDLLEITYILTMVRKVRKGNLAVFEVSNISETEEVTPTKIGVHAFNMSL